MPDTKELLALLQRHYIKPGADLPGGVFLPEVGWNPAGGTSGRDGGCDAIYVGFTSTSGRLLVGHELKVSRADWLNELNKSGKADAWADQCHQWWLVVSDPAIVHDGELPDGWGLMSPGKSKTRMQVHVKAETYRDRTPSWLAVRSVLARQDTLRASAISAARRRADEAAHAEITRLVESRVQAELSRAAADGQALSLTRDRLHALQKALGHNIVWDNKIPGFLNQTTLAEIEQIRQVLTEVSTVKAAARRLAGAASHYDLRALDNAVNAVRAALTQLNEAVTVDA